MSILQVRALLSMAIITLKLNFGMLRWRSKGVTGEIELQWRIVRMTELRCLYAWTPCRPTHSLASRYSCGEWPLCGTCIIWNEELFLLCRGPASMCIQLTPEGPRISNWAPTFF